MLRAGGGPSRRGGQAVIERPFAWIQARAGIGGMAAVFLAPNLVVFGIFILLPIVINAWYSLTGGGALFLSERSFVGLDQYRSLLDCGSFADPSTCSEDRFLRSVHNTAFFVVVQVALLVVAALATALVLDRGMRARGFWRAVFFFPVLLLSLIHI